MEMTETSDQNNNILSGLDQKEYDADKIEISSFTECLDSFIIFAEKVMQYDANGELKIVSMGNQSSAIKAGLNGYRTFYNKHRELPGHARKFTEVYTKCRQQFLREVALDFFMEWFKNQAFTILPQEKSRNKIHLTAIFRNCIKIADTIADEAARHPERENELLNDPAAMYPEHFMLYLFRIFYNCADETDRQMMIIPRIEELEINLGLRKNENPISSDGLSDILIAAHDIAGDLGLNIPKNAPLPSGGQLKGMLSQFTKNDEIKKTIKGVFEGVSMNDPKDLPSAIGKLLNRMSTTAQEKPDAIKRAEAVDSECVVSKK